MSEIENNATPEELVEEIEYEVDSADVIPTPVDPTLSISGEAADAKATGDAIAGVFNNATVNGKSAVNKAFVVYASDIRMSSAEGASTIAEAIGDIGDKDASEIMYDTVNMVTVKDAIDDIETALDSELTEEEIDEIFDEVFAEEGD